MHEAMVKKLSAFPPWQIEYTDIMISYLIEKRWKNLYNSSLVRAESLEPIKRKFSEMKVVEIDTFRTNVSVFSRKTFISLN